MTDYIKARTMAHDVVADLLHQSQKPDKYPADVIELCPQLVASALDLILKTGTTEPPSPIYAETALATPWLPYVEEAAEPQGSTTELGWVKLDAVIKHDRHVKGRLTGIGETTIRLWARPSVPGQLSKIMATLDADSIDLRGNMYGSGFYKGQREDFNFLRNLIEYDFKEALLPRDKQAESQKRLDKAHDRRVASN